MKRTFIVFSVTQPTKSPARNKSALEAVYDWFVKRRIPTKVIGDKIMAQLTDVYTEKMVKDFCIAHEQPTYMLIDEESETQLVCNVPARKEEQHDAAI